jgi:uncharacterized protein YqhQ
MKCFVLAAILNGDFLTIFIAMHNFVLSTMILKKPFNILHPRCGSSFLMLVIVISIIIFSFVPMVVYSAWPNLHESILRRSLVLMTLRIFVMLPIISGLSYELLKATGKYHNSLISRIISWPGLMLQNLTTHEPDDKQVKVAIAALKKLI